MESQILAARRERVVLLAASVLCLALIPLGLGWIPGLRHAWGFTFWSSLPVVVSAGLAAALAAWVLPPCRRLVTRTVSRAVARAPRSVVFWGPLVLVAVFWLLRERRLFADSNILLVGAAYGAQFLFPDVGATYLFGAAHRLSGVTGFSTQAIVQALVCLSGAWAAVCLAQLGRHLAAVSAESPSASTVAPGLGALAAALMLCGGLMRLFFGHVEVYAFVVLCASFYLLMAFRYLEGAADARAAYTRTGLALGLGIWMHLSFIFLIPSFLVLPLLHTRRRVPNRAIWRLWLAGAAAAAVPLVGFLVAMAAGGHLVDLERAWTTMLQWAGIIPNPSNHEAFLRGWTSEYPGGTRYVIFSWPHLKYLLNSAFVLVPAALPVLAGLAAWRPRSFATRPQASFLLVATGSMLVYTSIVRPVWGPYDWDLFSLTALCLAALATLLFFQETAGALRSELAALWIGASLLTVTVPMVLLGIAAGRGEGLYSRDIDARAGAAEYIEQIERRIEPFL